ncbi:MAG: hypothetical protein RSC98_10650, partial [Clostridia bacterium]
EKVEAFQSQMAQAAQNAADGFYEQHSQKDAGVVNVAQTVNFYEPVETPSRVARRVEEANEALGALLG